MVFSRARISRSIVFGHRGQGFAIDAHAVAFHRGQHGRERKINRLVKFREPLRFDFLAQQRREALQMVRVFAGSAGERDVFRAQHRVGEAVFRCGGTQQIRIQHRRVTNSRDGPGEQFDELGIVHDFWPRGIAQKFAQCAEHFARPLFRRAPSRARTRSRARDARLGRNFYGRDARAKAVGFAFTLRQREPDGDFGFLGKRSEIFLEGRRRFERRGIAGRRRCRGRRGKIAQQRSKTQFRVDRAQGFDVRLAAREVAQDQLHRRIRVNDRKLLRHQHRVAAVFQRLAVALAFDFLGMFERRFRRAETQNQFARAFFADPFRAGNVVDRIAHQGHHVGDFFRRHAHDLFDFCFVHHQIGLVRPRAGTQHAHFPADELHHVLVAGNQEHFEARFRSLFRQSAHHVVGLEAVEFEDRQPHGFAHAPHVGELHRKLVGHRWSLRLVLVEQLVAEGGLARIENHGEVVGRMLLRQLAQHVREKIGNFRGNALRAIEPRHRRKERAKNRVHRVDQKEFFRCGRFCHRREYSKGARASGVCYFIPSRFSRVLARSHAQTREKQYGTRRYRTGPV